LFSFRNDFYVIQSANCITWTFNANIGHKSNIIFRISDSWLIEKQYSAKNNTSDREENIVIPDYIFNPHISRVD